MRCERHPREFFLNVDGLHRQISYGKLPGLLELTTTHLQWTQDGKKALAVRVAHPEVTSPFSSKEGGAQAQRSAHDYNRQQTRCAQDWRGAQTPTSSPNNAIPAPAPSRPSNPKWCCERRFPHLNTPDLAALHRELVVSGQVTETEFWEGRESLRRTPSHILYGNCPKPNVENDIFNQSFSIRIERFEPPFVPPQLSMSLKTTQSSTKLEPRKSRDDEVEMFIALEATREDREEAGKRRGALPLIRKFNEHSERLLESAISTDGTGKRRRLDSGDGSDSSGVLLEMQDRQRYFESRAGAAASAEQAPRPAVDSRAAWQQMRRDLDGWQGHLAQLKTDCKAAEAALASMTENVATRLDAQKRKADIPEEVFGQMRTCQMATNEFLRQFWSAIYPPVGESTLGGPTTLAQKTAKARRIARYLTKMSEKFGAIVRAAEMQREHSNSGKREKQRLACGGHRILSCKELRLGFNSHLI
ncbi:hypothetical protein EDB85DRAFT_1895073 [Lactarius pseudohatsudake]|nr:hypothetical protein EDB85DRAFT_1895073 [Lactarius pseudohatsudake]